MILIITICTQITAGACTDTHTFAISGPRSDIPCIAFVPLQFRPIVLGCVKLEGEPV